MGWMRSVPANKEDFTHIQRTLHSFLWVLRQTSLLLFLINRFKSLMLINSWHICDICLRLAATPLLLMEVWPCWICGNVIDVALEYVPSLLTSQQQTCQESPYGLNKALRWTSLQLLSLYYLCAWMAVLWFNLIETYQNCRWCHRNAAFHL